MTTNTEQLLREALKALEHAEKDVADFQRLNTDETSAAIKSLRQALTQPAQAGEADTGPRVLREVFALCEATEEALHESCSQHSRKDSTQFNRGRLFEAKGIRKAIGTWFQDEFCGRSLMGEPVTTPPASQEQTDLQAVAGMLLRNERDAALQWARGIHLTCEDSGAYSLRVEASQEQAQQPSEPNCDRSACGDFSPGPCDHPDCHALRKQQPSGGEVERLHPNALRYEWLQGEHQRVDPICHLSWKRNGDRGSSEWVNTSRLDQSIARAIEAAKEA